MEIMNKEPIYLKLITELKFKSKSKFYIDDVPNAFSLQYKKYKNPSSS